jgi:sialate O-acetylesterase
LIYNAIINPFMPFSIKGILWYQGESNAGDIQGYDYLNAALIKSWRSSFRQGELPFYFVQMTPYAWKKNNPTENGYAKFREAQSRVLSVAGTGMVCTMDVGDPDDIHPTNKKPVGERLAFLALKNTYQKKVVSSGPLFKSWEISKGKLIVEFEKSSLGSGLTTADGKSPQHFMLAGADSVFYPATAIIENNKIVLKASAVKDPVAIRYAYTNAVITNLQNKEGWPAFPFRTDRWMKETIIIN